jgi:hypothetical protein
MLRKELSFWYEQASKYFKRKPDLLETLYSIVLCLTIDQKLTYTHVKGTMMGLVNGEIGDKFTSELGTLFAELVIDITTVGVAIGQS